jgi:N-acetylmuramoyl-L-alanine amidase
LVEGGFLTNLAEARKIASPEYRERLAAAIVAGIQDYAAAVAP